MKRSGYSDLPLHGGKVPSWLYQRMGSLGGAMVEVIVAEFGAAEFLVRMSDPFWFQSFGAVLGMDWHSSGITTALLGALKSQINNRSDDLGLYLCGGRGKHSLATPRELMNIGNKTGLNAQELVRASKLSAKVDNTAVQDGYQLYLHNFLLTRDGHWCVIQQGMNPDQRLARRYHWHSDRLTSFINDPHTSIVGTNMGQILNLADSRAKGARHKIMEMMEENPARVLKEIPYLNMPAHHDVRSKDVDLRRLGAMLYQAHYAHPEDFEALLLLRGMGPRTIQSLALVSEVIFGTPTRFSDPARFSFAHGGKDGHPFPVPVKVYDETIKFLNDVVVRAKIGRSEKVRACRALYELSRKNEQNFTPDPEKFDRYISMERKNSEEFGGRTVFDNTKRADRNRSAQNNQLELF